MAEERLIDAKIEEAEEARRRQTIFAEEMDRRLLDQMAAIMSKNQSQTNAQTEARACWGPELTEATPPGSVETLIQEITRMDNQFNPDKFPELQRILVKYKDHEHELLQALHKKHWPGSTEEDQQMKGEHRQGGKREYAANPESEASASTRVAIATGRRAASASSAGQNSEAASSSGQGCLGYFS